MVKWFYRKGFEYQYFSKYCINTANSRIAALYPLYLYLVARELATLARTKVMSGSKLLFVVGKGKVMEKDIDGES